MLSAVLVESGVARDDKSIGIISFKLLVNEGSGYPCSNDCVMLLSIEPLECEVPYNDMPPLLFRIISSGLCRDMPTGMALLFGIFTPGAVLFFVVDDGREWVGSPARGGN